MNDSRPLRTFSYVSDISSKAETKDEKIVLNKKKKKTTHFVLNMTELN